MRFLRFWPSSPKLLELNEFKLPHRFSRELMTVLAKEALFHAFLTAVILTSLHHAVTATVRAPSVLSSHHTA
jgi:hypothetical protein